MARKSFKKTLSLILAVMMILTSLPLSALTALADATEQTTATKGVVLTPGSYSRVDSSKGVINICNDTGRSNGSTAYTIGFWKMPKPLYDPDDEKASSASIEIPVDSQEGTGQNLQMNLYVVPVALYKTFVGGDFPNGSGVQQVEKSGYTMSQAISALCSQERYLGAANRVSSSKGPSDNYKITLNSNTMPAILDDLAANGSQEGYLIACLFQNANPDTGSWSDTWIGNPTLTYSLTTVSSSTYGEVTQSFTRGVVVAPGSDISGGTTRYGDNGINLCRDPGSSYSAGIWKYDVPQFDPSETSASNINLKVGVSKTSGYLSDVTVNFYMVPISAYTNWCTESFPSGTGLSQRSCTFTYGTESSGYFMTKMGCNSATLIGTVTRPAAASTNLQEFTITSENLTNLVNNYANNGQGFLIVAFINTQLNGSEANGWSDTWVSQLNLAYTVNNASETETDQDIIDAKTAISDYETKMSKVGKDGKGIYTNMLAAYNQYLLTCRYLDAYQYGGNDPTVKANLVSAAATLVTLTGNMRAWSDPVSGNITSKVPTFSGPNSGESTQTNMSANLSTHYGNILYTANNAQSNANGQTDDTDLTKAAITFGGINLGDTASVCAQVFFSDTILLYDGVAPARIPVAFMHKKWTTSARCCYTTYPAAAGAGDTYTSTHAPNHLEFQTPRLTDSSNDSCSKWCIGGSDECNTLDYHYAFRKSKNREQAGTSSGNPDRHYLKMYHSTLFSTSYYWNCCGAPFQVTDNIKFNNPAEGYNTSYKELDLYWAWYGGSTANANSSQNIDENLRYYGHVDNRHIYVINYKGLADTIKDTTLAGRLSNVAKFKEGGLRNLIKSYDDAVACATTLYFESMTTANMTTKANAMEAAKVGINTAPTPDADSSAYSDLKRIMDNKNPNYRKVYNAGNANNENYTAESWEVFATAYGNAVNHFANLANENASYNSADAAALVVNDDNEQIIPKAYDQLVLNFETVDTAELENIINNAEYILSNPRYFVSSTVDENLAAYVLQAKEAIWGEDENYGIPAAKLRLNDENTALVATYVDLLDDLVAAVRIDMTTRVSGYNISEAIATGTDKINGSTNGIPNTTYYSNITELQTAVSNASDYVNNFVDINPVVVDSAENKVNDYIARIQAIKTILGSLRMSFALIEHGTFASTGETVTDTVYSAARSDQFHFYWKHTTNMIIFQRERSEINFKLPVSEFGAYNKQTGTNFELLLDSININAKDVATAELTTNDHIGTSSFATDTNLSAQQIKDYPGGLSILCNNVGIKLDNFKVYDKSKAKAYGVDLNGNNITDGNYDFTALLGGVLNDEVNPTGTQGNRTGGIYALNGTTKFTADANINVPETSGTSNERNKPSKMSTYADLAETGTQIGFLYSWRYAPTLVVNWNGYAFDKDNVRLKIGVVNLFTFFNLTAQAQAMTPDANLYTTTSWDNLQEKLRTALGSMDYGSMTYEEIIAECDTRYENLYKAMQIGTEDGLKYPASNAVLKAALDETRQVYNEQKAKGENRDVSTDTWLVFKAAFENADSHYSGIYSDIGVRDYENTDRNQSAIDAYATALLEARTNLAWFVDFSQVDQNARTLINNIATETYTAESVRQVLSELNALEYYSMSDADRATHYTNEMIDLDNDGTEETPIADVVSAEAAVIAIPDEDTEYATDEEFQNDPRIGKYLVKGTVDASVLNALKETARQPYTDPDAYDMDLIEDVLAELEEFETINITGRGDFSRSVRAFTYANQTEANFAIAKVLENINIQDYAVTVDGTPVVFGYDEETGDPITTCPFGTEITVSPEAVLNAEGEEAVDWYYAMESNIAQTAKKYYSTGTSLTFVVRGTTTLTTNRTESQGKSIKVSYVNSVNGRTYNVDYVEEGTVIDLSTISVPKLAFYSADEENPFSVYGAVVRDNTITVTKDVRIYTNYVPATQDGFTVYIADIGAFAGELNFSKTGLKYNDELSFARGLEFVDDEGYALRDEDDNFIGKTFEGAEFVYTYNGEYELLYTDACEYESGRLFTDGTALPIKCWLEINPDDIDEWIAAWEAGDIISDEGTKVTNINVVDGEMLAGLNAKVVNYGGDYTFRVHQDTYLMAVTQPMYEVLKSYGAIVDEGDANGVRIDTRDTIVVTPGTKFSMISTYTVPDDIEVVETGILFAANKNSSEAPNVTLNLTNAGSNGILRVKSTSHTAGNQFVVSVTSTKLAGQAINSVGMKYCAYIIYRDESGKLVTVYSDIVTNPAGTLSTF